MNLRRPISPESRLAWIDVRSVDDVPLPARARLAAEERVRGSVDPRDRVVRPAPRAIGVEGDESDVTGPRGAGLDDRAIFEIVELVAVLGAIDRIANALGLAPFRAPSDEPDAASFPVC